MIVETGYISGSYYTSEGYGWDHPLFSNPAYGTYWIQTVHLDGTNVAFADGHVKWIKNGTMNDWIYNNIYP
jgi:prepilin-type processing-associated H-X9-DG protein